MEYILIVAVVVSVFMFALGKIREMNLGAIVTASITSDFSAAYRYGHPRAKGFEEGGPRMHPRVDGGQNFRIFLNPRTQ